LPSTGMSYDVAMTSENGYTGMLFGQF